MLAFAITLMFALYIFGPDAFSRFILDFSVPRRAVTLTKAEEVYRAVVWSIASLTIAYYWAKWWGTLARVWSWTDLKVCFAGLYSEQFFREHQAIWFHSVRAALWMNFCLLWRLYAAVLFLSVVLSFAIRFYANLRYLVRGPGVLAAVGRRVLAAMILPRVAPWHLLLSRTLIRDRGLNIHLDVMTKLDVLYQGVLADKTLAADGGLVNVTLEDPKRFQREEFTEDRKAGKAPETEDYWKKIPTNMFIIMGSEIHSINLRYVPENVAALKRQPQSDDLQKQLQAIGEALKAVLAVQPEINVSFNVSRDPGDNEPRDSQSS